MRPSWSNDSPPNTTHTYKPQRLHVYALRFGRPGRTNPDVPVRCTFVDQRVDFIA